MSGVLSTAVSADPDPDSPAARDSGNRVPGVLARLLIRTVRVTPGASDATVHTVRDPLTVQRMPGGGLTAMGRDRLRGVGMVTSTLYRVAVPGLDTRTRDSTRDRVGTRRGVSMTVVTPGPAARDVAAQRGADGLATADTT